MKKFIVIESGKEIKVGDTITIINEVETPFGVTNAEITTTATVPVIVKLIEDGKVKVVEVEDKIEYSDIWNAALLNLAEKTGWNLEKLSRILTTIDSVNPWAATQIVLREIAIELDKNYEDHINKSEEIYAISPQDGRIHKIDKKTVKSYRAFPAFRNIEDAKIACSLVRENLKSIFANA